jgi:uncharacterized repeat protein (TIGR02543 family)
MNLSKIFNCLVPSFFESKRGSVCLLFIVPFIILVGDEQQIVIHWTSETDSTSSILLKDRNGQILDSGNSNNGDGYLVTLGYFTDGNSTHPFGMDGTKWIPLTSGTRVGDSSSGYGYADGIFSFTTVFTKNSNVVSVYPNEPANYTVNSQHILESNKPPYNQQLCIRFYDRTITGPSARYNTVTGPNWKWPAWSTGSVPENYYFKISNGDSTRSDWEYGSNFEDPDNNFSTSLQVKANLIATATGGGSLNPNPTGPYTYDTEVTLNAVPDNTHREFVQWIGSGVTDSSSANTKVLMSEDRNVTAHFRVKSYNVTITKIGKGTVSGSGVYLYGSDANISATAATGYQFSHWLNYDSFSNLLTSGLDNNLSSSTSLTVHGGGNALVAVFDPLPYNITLNSTSGGNATIVQAPGPFYFDSNYTLSASPEYGYSFDSWTSSTNSLNLLSSTTSARPTFTLKGDASFTSNFSENQYLLTVLTGSGGASVSPSTPALYNHSSQVSITTTPLEGYEFDKWEDLNGSLLNFTDQNSTVDMSANAENVTVTALFKPKQYNVSLTANNGGQVSITPVSGPWEHFKVYPLVATPDPGYQFTNWTGDANSLNALTNGNSDANNSLAIVSPVSLSANFSLVDYNVSVTVASGNGTVSGGGMFDITDTPQVNAIANSGWHFSEWSGDVFSLNSNSSLSSTVNLSQYPQNISLQASFARNSYAINVNAQGQGLINNQSSLNLNPVFEDLIELNATASTGWEFNRWYGYPFSNPLSHNVSFPANSNLDLNASFQRKQFTLTIGTSPFGESNGSGTYSYEANAPISTIPKTGYTFSGWTGDTQFIANTNSSSTFVTIPNNSVSIIPTFTPKTYQITLSSDNNGTATGGGNYSYGTTANITATGNGGNPDAIAGYTLTSWTITNESGQISKSSSNPLTLNIDGNYSIFANFEPTEVQLHDLNISISPQNGGQIFNDPDLREWNNSTTTLSSVITATPNPGYSFLGWENPDSKIISPNFKSPTVTFTTDTNTSLIAKFTKNIVSSITRINGNGYTQTDSNETSFSLNAIPNQNNYFTGWAIDHNFTYDVAIGNSSVKDNSQVFFLNGKESPSLKLLKGYTYHFNCSISSHEFYLSTENNSTNFDQEYTHANLSGSRTSNGTLIFTVPSDYDTSLNLYYCSADDPFMGNKIEIIEAITDQQILPFPTQTNINPSVEHDISLLANFNLNQYAVSITAGNGGSISNGASGTYSHGSTINLTATPNPHFAFSHWEGTSFSSTTSTATTATISSASQINAVFVPILYDLSLSKNIAEAGNVFSVSNSYKFEHGTVINVQANPNPGYIFSSWSNGDTSSSTSVTMNQNTSISATFNRKTASVQSSILTLDIFENPELNTIGGFINPGSFSGLKVGESIQISANDYPGYQFLNWIEDNNQTDDARTKTLILDENQTIAAVFKRLSYEVNLISTPLVGGSIQSTPGSTSQAQKLTFPYGENVRITAVPDDNYQFQQWSGNGLDGLNTTSSEIQFTVNQNINVNAKFIPLQPLELKITIEPAESGFVIGNGSFIYNPTHPIYATPNTGYLFEKWEGVGIENAYLHNSSIVLNEDKTIKAKFKIDPNYIGTGNPTNPGLHTLSIVAIPSESGIGVGSGTFGTGWTDIYARSSTGFKFSYWKGNGVEDNSSSETRFFLTSNTTLQAVFLPLKGNDLISNATVLGNSWWYSDWFGPFWHREGDLWIYHAPLGWIYLIPENNSSSLWFWVDYLSGWQWTSSNIFPYLRGHTEARWMWFHMENSTQSNRLFFEYDDSSGNGNWKQF